MKENNIYPLYAEYGYLDTPISGHNIICFEGEIAELPKQLLGLTDVPPSAPNEAWWPSVGCAPLDDWFALWWTIPDFTHHRAGVVKSKVALWPLNIISEVTDISPFLIKIGTIDEISDVPINLLENIINQLISSEKPLIFSNTDIWPHLLSHLWKLLWPEAKRNFSMNLAFMPDHTSAKKTWIHCVPKSKIKSWPEAQFSRINYEEHNSSRISKYLLGESKDETLNTHFQELIFNYNHPNQLNKILRAAERYDILISNPSFENALNLLRTVNSIPQNNFSLEKIKNHCTTLLHTTLTQQSFTNIFSLSNLNFSIPPSKELETWFKKNLPLMNYEELKQTLNNLEKNSAYLWWQQALLNCIKEQTTSPTTEWSNLFLNLLVDIELSKKVKDLIPNIMENFLISVWTNNKKNKSLIHLIKISKEKKWYKIHAKCLINEYEISEAFNQQNLIDDQNIGMPILINGFPGNDVVQEILKNQNETYLELLAERTVNEPDLLNNIDISNNKWLKLWILHIEKNGVLWPTQIDQKELIYSIFNKLIKSEDTNIINTLLSKMTRELTVIIEEYDNREQFWKHLTSANKSNFLLNLGKRQLRKIQVEQIPEPEQILSNKIIELACIEQKISLTCLLNILSWNNLSEEQARELLRKIDWTQQSNLIGNIVSSRKWKLIAKDIYRAYKSGNNNFRLAAQNIKNLLNNLEKFMITHIETNYDTFSRNQYDIEDLVDLIAEVGADLAPNRLNVIWIKAKGKQKHLTPGLRPDDAWVDAMKIAFNTKGNKRLILIVNELINEFPHNEYLKAIQKQLDLIKKR